VLVSRVLVLRSQFRVVDVVDPGPRLLAFRN
jgi:hypothetical protein